MEAPRVHGTAETPLVTLHRATWDRDCIVAQFVLGPKLVHDRREDDITKVSQKRQNQVGHH
jgi:hypothetical protein